MRTSIPAFMGAAMAVAAALHPIPSEACEAGDLLHAQATSAAGLMQAAAVTWSGEQLILSLTIWHGDRPLPARFSFVEGQRNQLILPDGSAGRIGRVLQAERHGDAVHLLFWSGSMIRPTAAEHLVLRAREQASEVTALADASLEPAALP